MGGMVNDRSLQMLTHQKTYLSLKKTYQLPKLPAVPYLADEHGGDGADRLYAGEELPVLLWADGAQFTQRRAVNVLHGPHRGQVPPLGRQQRLGQTVPGVTRCNRERGGG